jgi:hypothetical protein
MSIQPVVQATFDFLGGVPVVVETSSSQLTSDAGLLAFRQLDERIGLTRAFAAALDDPRTPGQTDHTFLEMTRARVYGILAGYEDQNDHDLLRTDPVFKLVADRSPAGEPLASQPTLSRFEMAPPLCGTCGWRWRSLGLGRARILPNQPSRDFGPISRMPTQPGHTQPLRS